MAIKTKLFRILVDMDDTTCTLSSTWEKYIQDNGDPEFNWENVKSWDVSQWTTIGKKCYDIFKIEELFSDLPPLPNAIKTIDKLRKRGHTIHFVTSDPVNSPIKKGNTLSNAKLEKIYWLEKHFKWFKSDRDITFSHNKGEVKGDILFDDRPKWFYEFDGIFIIKDTHYNQNVPSFRVKTWEEFEALINKLSLYYGKD